MSARMDRVRAAWSAWRARGGPPSEEERAALRARLAGRRPVFCLTAGRSGSHRLGAMFGCVRGLRAEHEPWPHLHPVRRRAARDPEFAARFLARVKLPAAARGAGDYAETSHLFGKGFCRPMLSLGVPFDAVVLLRAPRAVALSVHALGLRPGREPAHRSFFVPPDEAELPLPDPGAMSDYQLAWWHVREVEARALRQTAAIRAAGGRVAVVRLEELSEPETFPRALETLGVDPGRLDPAAFAEARADRGNMKDGKKTTPPPDDPAAEEAAVIAAIRARTPGWTPAVFDGTTSDG